MRKTKDGPRQARAIETRERILAAGRDAFARLGHDRVNLAQDVLEPAGVSVGSFYHQFTDKTELLLVILHESAELRRVAVIDAGLNRSDVGGLDAGVRRAIEAFFDSLDDELHAWRLQINERSNADERVRQTVIAGRNSWIEQLAASFTGWSGADADRRRAAAQTLVGLGTGLAALYLDLPEDIRAAQRTTFIDSACAFASAGLTAMLHS